IASARAAWGGENVDCRPPPLAAASGSSITRPFNTLLERTQCTRLSYEPPRSRERSSSRHASTTHPLRRHPAWRISRRCLRLRVFQVSPYQPPNRTSSTLPAPCLAISQLR